VLLLFVFLAVVLTFGNDGLGLDLDFAFLHSQFIKMGANVKFIMRPVGSIIQVQKLINGRAFCIFYFIYL
jgi:hypothetical protein